MSTDTVLTDERILGVWGSTAEPCVVTQGNEYLIHKFARAIEQAVLQSPEVQRLRNIEKAALGVLNWTQATHRPPVREAIPCGETAAVRVHALADLHDALHPDSPAKTAAMEKQP